MKSLAIDLQGNTFLREDGSFRYTKDDIEYLAQKERAVLSLNLGEWFLDESLGIPYIPTTDSKREHISLLEAALRTKITSVIGIKKLVSFSTELDKATRNYRVTFVAETDSGELLEQTQELTVPAGVTGGEGNE